MKYRYLTTIAAAFLMKALTSLSASGAIVAIEYDAPQGPNWTGVVDTTSDTLTIMSWAENPGGTAYWTPVVPFDPWVARDSGGNVYDVPDTFNGTINGDFGFISDQAVTDISWNEGVPDAFTSTNRLGWGGTVFFGVLDVASFDESATGPVPFATNAGVTDVTGVVTATPIPEPASSLFLGFGGLALVLRRTKRG